MAPADLKCVIFKGRHQPCFKEKNTASFLSATVFLSLQHSQTLKSVCEINPLYQSSRLDEICFIKFTKLNCFAIFVAKHFSKKKKRVFFFSPTRMALMSQCLKIFVQISQQRMWCLQGRATQNGWDAEMLSRTPSYAGCCCSASIIDTQVVSIYFSSIPLFTLFIQLFFFSNGWLNLLVSCR